MVIKNMNRTCERKEKRIISAFLKQILTNFKTKQICKFIYMFSFRCVSVKRKKNDDSSGNGD